MSGTLVFRRTPKKWNGGFGLPLRDKIYNYVQQFNGNEVNFSDLGYFIGLRDATQDKDDIKNLDEIIEIIQCGNTVEFKMEY